MTPIQFQQAHGEWLKSILSDPKGQALLNLLASIQPPHASSEHVHLFAKEAGKREGFEVCIKSIVGLCNFKAITKEPEANYGVPDAPQEKKE